MSYSFGAHVSCQGGLLCGITRATEAGCDCLQVFVCQPRQWPTSKSCIAIQSAGKVSAAPAAPIDAMQEFRSALITGGYSAPVAHTSYLINLASPTEELFLKSIEALELEWKRAEELQFAGLVMHPGAHLSATPEEGLSKIAQGIEIVLERVKPKHCRLLLENTAGQGSCLGWQFEQLGWLIKRFQLPDQLGICFDTCHAFAAGYDFSSGAKVKAMWNAFDQHIGVEHLRAVHINDSKKGLGCRVDRHEHIGRGSIGETAFRHFLKSSPVKHLPMFLETPKGTDEETGEDLDRLNLATLRRLVKTAPRPPLPTKAN